MFKRSFLIIGFGLLLLFTISAGTVTAVLHSRDIQPQPTITPYPDPVASATPSVTATVSPTPAVKPSAAATSSPTPQPELPKSTAKPTPPA
jgi:hypothetical protein